MGAGEYVCRWKSWEVYGAKHQKPKLHPGLAYINSEVNKAYDNMFGCLFSLLQCKLMLAVRGVNARLQSKLRYNVYEPPVRHLRPIYVSLLEPRTVKLPVAFKCFGNWPFFTNYAQ